jgi:hypothetical protein
MLTREGIAGSTIHIGVLPTGQGLSAHAWVTLNGTIIGDDPQFVRRFTPIAKTEVVNPI